jgi:serine/threonine protein kinase
MDASPHLRSCPDEDDLVLYLEAQLSRDEVARFEEHFDACAACHRVAAALAQADSRPFESGSAVNLPSETRVAEIPSRRASRLSKGSVVGRYVVGDPLGEGGMGVVYAAHDSELDRDVALKVVSGRGRDSSGLEKRLLREARLAAQLRHPNVVVVHDVGEDGGCAYLAMELVRGRSLRAYVGDARVPVGARLGWLVDVARGLAAAHAQGLVHRDVKPENVMVDEAGIAKVVDFGIARSSALGTSSGAAKSSSMASTVTQKGTLIGTPSYMAPEQLRDEPVDARIDQFAWGVVAHELLSGARPWKERSLAMVSEILTADPPPLPESLPRPVRAVIRRAMQKSPAQRFASMDEVVLALGPFAHAGATLERSRPVTRTWPVAAAVAVSAVGLAVFLGSRANSTPRAREFTPMTVAAAAPEVRETAPLEMPPLAAPVARPEVPRTDPVGAPHVLPPSPRSSAGGPATTPAAAQSESGVASVSRGTPRRLRPDTRPPSRPDKELDRQPDITQVDPLDFRK